MSKHSFTSSNFNLSLGFMYQGSGTEQHQFLWHFDFFRLSQEKVELISITQEKMIKVPKPIWLDRNFVCFTEKVLNGPNDGADGFR